MPRYTLIRALATEKEYQKHGANFRFTIIDNRPNLFRPRAHVVYTLWGHSSSYAHWLCEKLGEREFSLLPRCPHCEENESPDDGEYCEPCMESHSTCTRCDEFEPTEDGQTVDDTWYCERCISRYFWRCVHCEDLLSDDLSCYGDGICEACYESHYFTCESCDNVCHNDNYGSDGRCTDCEENQEEPETESEPDMSGRAITPSSSMRSVGYELEMLVDSRPSVSPYGRRHDDRSISGSGESMEFASYPQPAARLAVNVPELCARLRAAGARVNISCGFHVHVDVSDLTDLQRKNLRQWWRIFEPFFVACTSESRRRNGYSHRVTGGYSPVEDSRWEDSRYWTLNLQAYGEHGTYEFRLHQGTINPRTILYWTTLLVAFVDRFATLAAWPARVKRIANLSDREKLALLLQRSGVPLSVRKHMLYRMRFFARQCGTLVDLSRPRRQSDIAA